MIGDFTGLTRVDKDEQLRAWAVEKAIEVMPEMGPGSTVTGLAAAIEKFIIGEEEPK